ncbi:hypothetical protein ACFFJT_06390 [Dyella flava]|uniref:Uncharacterized protein n=1 Tax=Dyella flava TaxID=1920170 RepID=A0ABS2K0V3_9GAMM|nr:hypothetical protein [Dyella flava]MBM7124871.1 hypothetical protein [Dyella flava]GLQ50912.1 hypothetical protein GCM10010872_23610 [Dyella flava]
MDTAYASALAALAGSAIGGLTSLTASWLTQRVQFTAQQRAAQLGRREELYRNFIEEASKWYADAYEHDTPKVSNLVGLYAMVSRMRVLSAPSVVEQADNVVRAIIKAYLSPNKTFRDIGEVIDDKAMNPLRDFSNACRDELSGVWNAPL